MNKKSLQKNAKILRTQQTDAEKNLWYYLRNRQLNGYKFKRQVIYGSYIIDFVCLAKGLVIEIDGSQQIAYDIKRTQYLESLGLKVLRFWNCDILSSEITAVLEVIAGELDNLKTWYRPHPNPLPQAGEGMLATSDKIPVSSFDKIPASSNNSNLLSPLPLAGEG